MIFLPVLFLGGCATQMPATEGLVFAGKQTSGQLGQSKSDNDDHPAKYRYGFSGGFSLIIPPGSFKRASARRFKNQRTDTLDVFYLYAITIPSGFLSFGDRVSLGSNLLPLPEFWQLDGTVRLFRHYYLTLSKKVFHLNTQIILERRLLYYHHGGISVGVFYRYDPFKFESISFNPDFNISWFGVRGFFQSPIIQDNNVHVRGIVNLGYVPELKAPLFVIGLSAAFSFHPESHKRRYIPPGPLYY
jgi:hypothetical protein